MGSNFLNSVIEKLKRTPEALYFWILDLAGFSYEGRVSALATYASADGVL
jgi:ribosomal protein L18